MSIMTLEIAMANHKKKHEEYLAQRAAGTYVPVKPSLQNTIVAAIPPDKWPDNCKELAKKAIPTDKGLGDVAARLIANKSFDTVLAGSVIAGQFGNLNTFIGVFKWLVGEDCGCTDKQVKLNALYPLKY